MVEEVHINLLEVIHKGGRLFIDNSLGYIMTFLVFFYAFFIGSYSEIQRGIFKEMGLYCFG